MTDQSDFRKPIECWRDFMRFIGADGAARHLNWALDVATPKRMTAQVELAESAYEGFLDSLAVLPMAALIDESTWRQLMHAHTRLLDISIQLGGCEESTYE